MDETAMKEELSVTLVCQRHGEYTDKKITYFFRGMEPRELLPECPLCRHERDEEKRREEEKAEKQRVIRKWQSMNIDAKFHDSTFDNFDAYNNELFINKKICRAFADKPDGKLIMIGENGNGKTHLAVSILKKLGGVIYKAFEIGVNLRQSYNGDTMEASVYRELCTAPLLIIDEVEKIKDSEARQNWMSYVVGKRYDRMLPLILIANCHTQRSCTEQAKPCPKCLEYHLENDVLSRIIEDGIILEFNSPDYREKIKAARIEKGG